MFRPITDWLGHIIDWFRGVPPERTPGRSPGVPRFPPDTFPTGPRPHIVMFRVMHDDCAPAWDPPATGPAPPPRVTISYQIDPNGATVNSIEIFRVYTLGATPFDTPPETWPPDDPRPRDRWMPTGEYFESVRKWPTPTHDELSGDNIPDPGLRPGGHWGHAFFYHQYRIVVQTPDRSISESRDVAFGPNPRHTEPAGSKVGLPTHSPGVTFVTSATFWLGLDNVSASGITVRDPDHAHLVFHVDSITYEDRHDTSDAYNVVATISLSGRFFVPVGYQTIRFTFPPLEDATCFDTRTTPPSPIIGASVEAEYQTGSV